MPVRRILLHLIIGVLACPLVPSTHAQQPDLLGKRVVVQLACHRDAWAPCRGVRGMITGVDPDGLVLDSSISVDPLDLRGLRYQDGTHRPIGTGALVGGGLGWVLGSVIGAAATDPCTNCFLDFSQLEGALQGGLIGLLLGGLVGAGVASAIDVDTWHTVNGRQLESLGAPGRGPSVGVAFGFDFPTGGNGPFVESRAASPSLMVRGTLAPKGSSESYVELSVRRIAVDSDALSRMLGVPGAQFPEVETKNVLGLSVGSKSWLGFLGSGRVLPYFSFSVGYQSGGEEFDSVVGKGFRTGVALGADVFTSARSDLFVEVQYLYEEAGEVRSVGIMVGGRVR